MLGLRYLLLKKSKSGDGVVISNETFHTGNGQVVGGDSTGDGTLDTGEEHLSYHGMVLADLTQRS
jgi:hypothetical protein